MLTITREAAELLKVAKAVEGAEDHVGIRIQRGVLPNKPGQITVGIQITDEPGPGDEEFEQEGLRIFVEEALIEPLDGYTLDIRNASEGLELIFR